MISKIIGCIYKVY